MTDRERGGVGRASFRPGAMADMDAVYELFAETVADLDRRTSASGGTDWADPAFLAGFWERNGALFRHLTETAERFWVAESDGRMAGYARSTLHDGVRELTEFFVHPDQQSGGIGRELLARAFPVEGARRRVIIGTADLRAVVRYLKAGVYPRFPIYYASRAPRSVEVATDLTVVPASATAETLAALRMIDAAILDMTRDPDHDFLLRHRQAKLYYRGDVLVGYGYFGAETGPIALLNDTDFPAVLARAETEAAARNEASFAMNVPLINRAAVDYLLGQGFQLEDFITFLFSDEPFGRFEHYIVSSPNFFL